MSGSETGSIGYAVSGRPGRLPAESPLRFGSGTVRGVTEFVHRSCSVPGTKLRPKLEAPSLLLFEGGPNSGDRPPAWAGRKKNEKSTCKCVGPSLDCYASPIEHRFISSASSPSGAEGRVARQDPTNGEIALALAPVLVIGGSRPGARPDCAPCREGGLLAFRHVRERSGAARHPDWRLAPQPDRTLRSAPDAPGATTLLGILVLGTAGDPSGPLRDVRGTPGILGLVPAGAGWGRDRSLLPRRGNRSPSPRSPDEWGVPPTTPRLTRLKYRSPRVVRSGCCPAAPPRTGRAASSGWLPRHPPREPAPDARTLAQRHRPAFSGRRV